MKQLAKLQYTFQDCVLDPKQSTSTDWISAEGRAAPEIQLSVYSYAYRARLQEVLANDFPAALTAIGEDYFEQLSTEYIKTHPSTFFSLRDFGAKFPSFVCKLIQQDTIWQEMPWLYELTLFEWNLGQAFDATDDIVFTEEDMRIIAPEAWPDLRFKVHSSVIRLDFEWNVIEMWQVLTDETPTDVNAEKETSTPWLIWRENLTTRFRSMQINEKIAFDKLTQGANFTDICEALTGNLRECEVPMYAASLLKGWIAQGLISSVIS